MHSTLSGQNRAHAASPAARIALLSAVLEVPLSFFACKNKHDETIRCLGSQIVCHPASQSAFLDSLPGMHLRPSASCWWF